jgi:hypothetical protein
MLTQYLKTNLRLSRRTRSGWFLLVGVTGFATIFLVGWWMFVVITPSLGPLFSAERLHLISVGMILLVIIDVWFTGNRFIAKAQLETYHLAIWPISPANIRWHRLLMLILDLKTAFYVASVLGLCGSFLFIGEGWLALRSLLLLVLVWTTVNVWTVVLHDLFETTLSEKPHRALWPHYALLYYFWIATFFQDYDAYSYLPVVANAAYGILGERTFWTPEVLGHVAALIGLTSLGGFLLFRNR